VGGCWAPAFVAMPTDATNSSAEPKNLADRHPRPILVMEAFRIRTSVGDGAATLSMNAARICGSLRSIVIISCSCGRLGLALLPKLLQLDCWVLLDDLAGHHVQDRELGAGDTGPRAVRGRMATGTRRLVITCSPLSFRVIERDGQAAAKGGG